MKTAVSLPDGLYKDAEELARSMGVPRSRLFAMALEEYIDRHRSERITAALDKVYSGIAAGGPESQAGLELMRELTRDDSW